MSYFDEDLIQSFAELNIPYEKLTKSKHDLLVNKIKNAFVFSGSQINWSLLRESVSYNGANPANLATLTRDIKTKNPTEIIFIGDSLTDHAYQVDTNDLAISLRLFSEIPQHTYVLPENLGWIACINFDGHIDFHGGAAYRYLDPT